MFEAIKNWLYEVITASGIIIHLLPIIGPIMKFFIGMILKGETNTYKITDAGGATLNVLKYNGKFYPNFGMNKLVGLKNVRIRKDDVLLCGYPKTGCHWVHEIMHMLVTGKAEMTKFGKGFGGMIELMPQFLLDSLPSPRVLNSHVAYEDLPTQTKPMKTKIVWTVRSPKDTVVSYYNHTQTLKDFYQYDGTFDNFFKLFMLGDVEYGSYFDCVLAWEKVMKSQKDNEILVVEYENLKKDTFGIVKNIARFLDVAITDDFAHEVVEATKFSSMKAKRSNNKIFRKGQIGDWHNWLSKEQSADIDQVWRDRMSKCSYKPEL